MLFSSGLGVGLVFYGVAEPMEHYMKSPFLGGPIESAEAARIAMGYTYFHWGISQWSIFGIVAGLAIGYFQFRKNRDGLVSTALEPLFGLEYNQNARKAIDILAIIATITGMSTSVGFRYYANGRRSGYRFRHTIGPLTQIILTALMTELFIFSTITGLKRGMKFLNSLNMILALVITVFIMAVGPFTFIMETIIVGLSDYLTNFVGYSLRLQLFRRSLVRDWTVFYWAWVIAWSRSSVHSLRVYPADAVSVNTLWVF